MSEVGNDNHDPNLPLTGNGTEAYGQAAFLLVESLIFTLRETGALTTKQAVETVETAAEVKLDLSEEAGDVPETSRRSIALIGALAMSLRTDQ